MKPIVTIVAAAFMVLAACSGKPSPPAQTAAAPTELNRTTLYYFHRTIRCTECLSMELHAGKLVNERFADALASGRLAFVVVNIDEPDNEHYADDFNLTYSTLVLADEDPAGNVLRWKDLEDAWLKSQDETAFKEYVTDQITAWLTQDGV